MTTPVPLIASEAASCAHGCSCSGNAPPTMSDYIDRGLRRMRRATLPIAGDARHDDGGRAARFSVQVQDGRITDVVFEASTCVTLVAYCEVLTEWITGQTIAAAVRRLRPADLQAALPLVPLAKRETAGLAAQAAMAALLTAARKDSA